MNMQPTTKTNLFKDSDRGLKEKGQFITSLISCTFVEYLNQKWCDEHLLSFEYFQIIYFFADSIGWVTNSFLIPVFLPQYFYMKLYVYQPNNVNKSNKTYQLIKIIWFYQLG